MVIINVLPCLEVLTVFHKYYEDQYLLKDDERSSEAQKFFSVRESLLSYLISRDALTDAYTEGLDILESSLQYIQDVYLEMYNEQKDIYFVKNDKVYA